MTTPRTADEIKLDNLEETLATLEERHAAVPSLANLRRVQAVKGEIGALLASMPAADVVKAMRR